MTVAARFVHTNVVAKDWRRLVRFYEEVLGCTPVPPERDLSGEWLEKVTGVAEAHILGMHLKLPGHGPEGPTLEVFQYCPGEEKHGTAVNRQGFAHIAFSVEDVDSALQAVKSAGGGAIGEIVSLQVAGAGTVTIVYATDPEGNIIELQKWSK